MNITKSANGIRNPYSIGVIYGGIGWIKRDRRYENHRNSNSILRNLYNSRKIKYLIRDQLMQGLPYQLGISVHA